MKNGNKKNKIKWSNINGQPEDGIAKPLNVGTKISSYTPPKSVIPKGKSQKVIGDSFCDLVNAGLFNGYESYMSFPGYPALSILLQKSEIKIATEEASNEPLRKGFEIKCESDRENREEVIEKLNQEIKRFDIKSIIKKAGFLGESMGAGNIIAVFEGDDTDKQEVLSELVLSKDKIKKKSLKQFKVIEPIWMYPAKYNASNPLDDYFYDVELWFISGGLTVHSSRVFRVIPYPLPDILKPAFNFGGLSLTQMMIPYVKNYESVRDEIPEILKTFRTYILKTDLQALAEDKCEFERRMNSFVYGKTNHGVYAIDKDSEDIAQINTSLSELSNIFNDYLKSLCIPSRLSATKLTGIQPSGMSATGEGERQALHETIASKQENIYKPALNWMLKIIMLNEYGEIFEDIFIDFPPIEEISEIELAQVNKIQSEIDIAYLESGVLSAEQVVDRIAKDPESGYEGITYEEPEDYDPETDSPEPSNRNDVQQGDEKATGKDA